MKSRSKFYLFVLTILMAMATVAVMKKMGIIASIDAKRYIGVIFSFILIGFGNFLPKLALPMNSEQSVHRFGRMAGWGALLLGVVLVFVWLFVPAAQLLLVAATIGILGMAVILGLMLASGVHVQEPKNGASGAAILRYAIMLMFLGVFGANAIFFFDATTDGAIPKVLGFVMTAVVMLLAVIGHFRYERSCS